MIRPQLHALTNTVFGSPASTDETAWEQGWLDSSGFIAYLLTECADIAPLNASHLLVQLREQVDEQTISAQQLLLLIETEFRLQQIDPASYHRRDLHRILPLAFACRNEQFLPVLRYPQVIHANQTPDDVKLFFITNTLPSRKLSKVQFVQELLRGRNANLAKILLLGTIPVLLAAGAELFNSPCLTVWFPLGKSRWFC